MKQLAEDALPADDIFWTVRALRTFPKIVATKNLEVYLILDKTVNPDHLKLDPCELWGFNAGDWENGKVGELQGSGQFFDIADASRDRCIPLAFDPRMIPK